MSLYKVLALLARAREQRLLWVARDHTKANAHYDLVQLARNRSAHRMFYDLHDGKYALSREVKQYIPRNGQACNSNTSYLDA